MLNLEERERNRIEVAGGVYQVNGVMVVERKGNWVTRTERQSEVTNGRVADLKVKVLSFVQYARGDWGSTGLTSIGFDGRHGHEAVWQS